VTEALQKSGEVLTDEAGNEIPHLTRLEMQYREAPAAKTAELIGTKGLGVIPKLIAGYVSFLSNRDSRTAKRKRLASWWTRIVGDDREYMQLLRGTATPDDSIAWIQRQVLITLKLIKEKAPDDWEKLMTKQIEDVEVQPLVRKKWCAWATARDQRKKAQNDFDQYERDERVLAEIRKVWPERCGKEVSI
jgi:hypothetical protein